MSRTLSLHHLTALDATPGELVSIAHRLQCECVSLFTWVPPHAAQRFPLLHTAAGIADVRARLRDTGVRLCNLEVFPLDASTSPETYHAALARGADLGAARATAHVQDSDPSRAADLFGAFCTVAASHGLRAGLEFTSFSAVRTLDAAARIVRDAAAGNGDIAFDPLHHMRNGGDAAGLAGTAIGYAQLCDGPLQPPADLYAEAVSGRGIPGEGAFPLQALLQRIAPHIVIDIEVPQHAARDAGATAFERAQRAVHGARAVIARADAPSSTAWATRPSQGHA